MDLRLLVPAMVVWAVTITGLLAPVPVLATVAIGAGTCCTVCIVACRRGLVAWRMVGLVVVGAGLAATCAVALLIRQEQRLAHPLTEVTGKVTVTMVVRDDPVLIGQERHGRVRARVTVDGIGTRRVPAAAAELTGDVGEFADLLPGQRVRALVRVRPPPRGTVLVASLTASGPPTAIGRPPVHQRVAGSVRDRLQITSSRALSAAAAGLLPGLVIGDVRSLDPSVREQFRDSGLSHLTAVSGSNFAIVCGAVLLAVRAAGASPRVAAVLGAVTIIGFVILVRPSPSVVRAAIMGGVGLLALLSSRRAQAFPALGAAVIGGLLWWPELALAPGFALSVVATAGLVMWAPRLRDRLRGARVPAGLAEVLAMAIAAQVVTAPVVAMVTGTFSVVGVIANLLVAPVVALISVVGTGAAILGALGPPGGIGASVGELLIRGLGPELWWMLWCARTLGSPRWANIPVPDGVAGAAVVALVTATVIVGVREGWCRMVRAPSPTRKVLSEWHSRFNRSNDNDGPELS